MDRRVLTDCQGLQVLLVLMVYKASVASKVLRVTWVQLVPQAPLGILEMMARTGSRAGQGIVADRVTWVLLD